MLQVIGVVSREQRGKNSELTWGLIAVLLPLGLYMVCFLGLKGVRVGLFGSHYLNKLFR